jgi:ribosomal protein S27E
VERAWVSRILKIVAKRRFAKDSDLRDEYVNVECPDCGAPTTLRFGRGRRSRRMRCPVCLNMVTISIEDLSVDEASDVEGPLVKLRRASS